MHDNNTHANHVNRFVLDLNVAEAVDAVIASVNVGYVLSVLKVNGLAHGCLGSEPDGHKFADNLLVTNVGKATLDTNDHVAMNDPPGNITKGILDSGVAESNASLALGKANVHEIVMAGGLKAAHALPIVKNLIIAK